MNIKDHEAAIRKKLDALRRGIEYDRYEATFKGEYQVQGDHITVTVSCSVPCPAFEKVHSGERYIFPHRPLPYKDVDHIKDIFEEHFGHVFRAIKHNGINSGHRGTYFLLTLQLEDESKRTRKDQ